MHLLTSSITALFALLIASGVSAAAGPQATTSPSLNRRQTGCSEGNIIDGGLLPASGCGSPAQNSAIDQSLLSQYSAQGMTLTLITDGNTGGGSNGNDNGGGILTDGDVTITQNFGSGGEGMTSSIAAATTTATSSPSASSTSRSSTTSASVISTTTSRRTTDAAMALHVPFVGASVWPATAALAVMALFAVVG